MSEVPDAQTTDMQTTDAQPRKPTDSTLLAAVDLARTALLEITTDDSIGEVIGHLDEGDLVVSLLFDCLLTGYPGWRWTVSLARVDESSEPTVLETELTPGDDSLLAPDWVPWSDRLVDDEISADADESDSDDDDDDDDDDESELSDDDDESDEDSDDDAEAADDDADDSLDALNGIDFDEALAAAEPNPSEAAEAEADADQSAPQPPTRSRRARRP